MPYSSHHMRYLWCYKLCFCLYILWFCYHMWCLCHMSWFSIIPTFCRSISTVLSLYRVVYALYGVQTILPRVHFALFAVLSSFHILNCCYDLPTMQSTRVGSKLLAAWRRHFGLFSRKVEERSLLWKPSLRNWGLVTFWKDSSMRKWIHMSYWPCRKVL